MSVNSWCLSLSWFSIIRRLLQLTQEVLINNFFLMFVTMITGCTFCITINNIAIFQTLNFTSAEIAIKVVPSVNIPYKEQFQRYFLLYRNIIQSIQNRILPLRSRVKDKEHLIKQLQRLKLLTSNEKTVQAAIIPDDYRAFLFLYYGFLCLQQTIN